MKPRRIRSHDGDISTNYEEKEDLRKDKSIHDEEEQLEEEHTHESQEYSPTSDTKTPSRRIQNNHLATQIIGDKNVGVSTRRQL